MFSWPTSRTCARLSIMTLAVTAALPSLARAAGSGAASPEAASAAVGGKPAQPTNKSGASLPVTRLAGVSVTRKRTQTAAAVATKQVQDRVMDVVTKEQIQAVPDATATDAVKRVAGVSVSFNSDNVNGRDEAQFIAIRGLDSSYNSYTFDGAPMASTDQTSRGVRTNMLPSSLIKQIRVFKTWQPDQDPNAVGGSVDFITRSAFDNGNKPYFSITGALGHMDGTGKLLSSAEGLGRKTDAVFSTTFGPTHALGLVVEANYEKENFTTLGTMTSDTIFYNYYNANGTIANSPTKGGPNIGNGIPVPQQFKYWMMNKNIERQGVNAKLEAKFNPDLYGFVEFGYNEENVHQTRIENIVDDARDVFVANPVLNQTPTSGRFALGAAEAGFEQNAVDRTLASVQGGLDWKLGGTRTLSLRSSFSDASQSAPQQLIKYDLANVKYNAKGGSASLTGVPGLGINYDTSGFTPSFAVNPAVYTNFNNWNAIYWQHGTQTIEDRVGNLQLDFRQNMDADSRGLGYAVGIDYRHLGHSFNVGLNEFVPTSGSITLAGVGQLSGTTLPGSNGLPFMLINPSAAWTQMANSKNVAPFSGNLASSLQSNYSHTEDNFAGYLMGAYRTDRLTAMFGVRQDNTNLSTTGNVSTVAGGQTSWGSVTNGSHYGFTLPAASLIFNATDAVRLKLAASQTIGRPTYDDYAPNTTISQNSDGSVTVTEGNPNIKPRQSNNFDFSAEWYLPNSGLASFAAFHKQIKDEIYTLSSQGQVFFQGQLQDAAITQPLNSSNSSLNGIELNFTQGTLGWIHPYLSGLGFSANLTLLRGRLNAVTASGTARTINGLVNQPDQIRNLTVFYNHGKYGVSAAYNWTGQSLRLVDANLSSQDVYWQARKEIDLQAHYDPAPGWRAFFEVANVTNSPVVSVTGPNKSLLKDSFTLGRTFWLGLTYTPKL